MTKYATEEERIEAIRESKRKYNKSAKGKRAMKEWYDKNKNDHDFKEMRNSRQQEYRETLCEDTKEQYRVSALAQQRQRRIDHPAYPMLNDARKRAKQKGIEFSISLEDIFIPEICPVLGIPLYVVGGKRTDNSPSLDRVDNGKGYSPDNICVISCRANQLKNDGSIEEFQAIIKYMQEWPWLGTE